MEELLKDIIKIMENSVPVLLLGAGFSIGATNEYGPMPNGEKLKVELLTNFFSGDEIDELSTENLKEVCSNIVNDGNANELNNYLTNKFKDATPAEWQFKFAEYPWNKIYTLNIDDVVEKVYEKSGKKLIVQRKEQEKATLGVPILIKLHGDVRDSKAGYVFSDNEYMKNFTMPNCSIDSFSHDFFENDTIFIGTEFDEDDIQTELFKRYKIGYNDFHQHYFVSPEIKSRKIRKLIERHDNYHHIAMRAEDFIANICNVKNRQDNLSYYESQLKSAGFLKVSDALKIHQSDTKIYSGAKTTYDDIKNDYDIDYYDRNTIFSAAIGDRNSVAICIYGRSFIGKSTYAKRLLYDFAMKDYYAFELKVNGVYDFDNLCNYLNLISYDNVAILFEEAAMFYSYIAKMLTLKFVHVKKIVAITTASQLLHNSKCHDISNFYNYYPVKLSYEINDIKARIIYNKLEEKNRLGTLSEKQFSSKKRRLEILNKQGNLINCLYYVSRGEGYETYFENEYINIANDRNLKKLLYDVILFSIMGIESYPASFVRHFYGGISNERIQNLDSILDVDANGNLKIRAADFFKRYVINENNNFKLSIIKKYLIFIKDEVNEQKLNTSTIVFECLLHFNSLKKELKINFDTDELDNIFKEIEPYFKNISYYWLERALLKANKHDYDSAYLYLSQAREIRPNSFKINHAYAQNYLDRGLELLKMDTKDPKGLADYEEGEKLMIELIYNDKYTENKSHSIHTYIDRRMKYYQLLNIIFTQEQYDEMCNLLLKVIDQNNDDAFLVSLKNALIDYAREYGLKQRM